MFQSTKPILNKVYLTLVHYNNCTNIIQYHLDTTDKTSRNTENHVASEICYVEKCNHMTVYFKIILIMRLHFEVNDI